MLFGEDKGRRDEVNYAAEFSLCEMRYGDLGIDKSIDKCPNGLKKARISSHDPDDVSNS